jgi:protein disulfide-isomerase
MAEHLAEKIPQRQKWAQEMMDSMTQNAKNSGLNILKKHYNSFNAHHFYIG